jgi:hypothetical protein
VRRVDALDVERGVGLGVATRLRFGKHRRERRALCAHLGQDEVRCAVDDARDPLQPIGGKTLAQRLDDRNTAGDRTFEGHHHALGMRRREDLVAVPREQRLVRRDDVLAVGDRLQDERARGLEPADQFDDDVDVRIGEHRRRIGSELEAGAPGGRRTRLLERALGDPRDPDRASRTARDLFRVALQHLPRAEADGAEPEEPHLQRFHLRTRHRDSCIEPFI